MFFEDGHPLCLGGVGGDNRPDSGRSETAVQFMGIAAQTCRLGDKIGRRALHRRFAAYAFGLAAQSHRGMLFDNGKQLEPNSVGLENTGEQNRREILRSDFPPAPPRPLDVGGALRCQQLEQYVRGFLAIEHRFNVSRRIAGLNPMPAGPNPVIEHLRGYRTPNVSVCGLRLRGDGNDH